MADKKFSQEANREFTGPDRDAIAEEAYARYQARGYEDGHDVEDWLEAEKALLPQRRSDHR